MATFNNGEAGLSVRTKLNNVLQHADGTTSTLTFNDAGADVDVRIEGVGQTHAFFLDAGTSNVGIGTSTASSKLTVAGDANVAGVATAVAMRDSTNRRIVNPGGGSYTIQTPTVTGAIAITLPVGFTDHMMRMKVSVYEYVTQESFDIIISGYNYLVGATWLNCSAAIVSNNATDRDFTVRFGYNATSAKCIIYIGELASTWSYPQVNITDVQLGFTTTGFDAWDDGWNISFVTASFQNVTQTLTNNRVGARLIGTGQTTAALTDAGARSDMLRLSSVGTAAGTGGGIIFTNSQGDTANSVGMAAIKSLLQDGSSNTRGDLAFSTRNAVTDTNLTERMRIMSDGRVGIGTTTPTTRLHLNGGGNTILTIQDSSGVAAIDFITGAGTQRIISGLGGTNNIGFYTASTERMRIDASGNLGISATPPANTTYPGIFFPQSGMFDYQGDGWLFYNVYTTGVGALKYRATGLQVAAYSFGQAGTHTWHSAPSGTAGNAVTLTQRMILDNAGQLGIGTNSPSGKLHVNANGGTAILEGTDHSYLSFYPRTYATGRKAYAGFASTSITNFSIVNEDTGSILLGTNGSTSNFIISPLGNIGINNTPRTWGNSFKAISINGAGSHIAANGSNRIELGTNSYVDTDNTTRRYDVTQAATTYIQATGEHQWYTAPSGTAGAAITFTQAMTLDNTGELGIGTTSPQAKLDVRGAALGGTATNSSLITHFAAPDSNLSQLRVLNYRHTTGTDHTTGEMRLQKRVDATDFGYIGFRHNAITFGTTAEQLRIDSNGNVGIGVTAPTRKLQVLGSTGTIAGFSGTTHSIRLESDVTYGLTGAAISAADTTLFGSYQPLIMNGTQLGFSIQGTERMRLDANGNLGLGVTPSAWGSTVDAIDISTAGSLVASSNAIEMYLNSYWNGTSFLYKNTAVASKYEQSLGAHKWYIAPSGTAGNAITFTQPMTLDTSGLLLLGRSTSAAIGTTSGAQLQILTGNTAGSFVADRPDPVGAIVALGKLRSGGIVSNGDYLGAIRFAGHDGTDVQTSTAHILGVVDGTPGTDTMPTAITLGTGPAATSIERMRIDSSGGVGIGGTANASALLDVQSTTRGFLPPRMTTTQRNAISSPATGLVIYNTTTGREEGYDGAAWIPKVPLDIEEDRIINGAFDIWQRGAGSTGLGYAGADRWVNEITGGTVTQSRQSFAVGDTLGMNSPLYFLRQSVTGQTLASQYAITAQRIEGVRSYAGQTITILGWAKRATAGNIVIEGFQNFGTGGTPSAGVATSSPTTIALTTSWTPFAAVMTVPSISGKTLGTAGNDWFGILFWTSAGSDFNARTNSLGLQTTDVDFWGIHIREGVWNTADALLYRQKSVVSELDKCYRYYYRVTADNANARFAIGHNTSTTNAIGLTNFPVRMRVPPTALEQSGTASQYAVYYLATGAVPVSVPAFVQATYMTAITQITLGTAVLTAGQGSSLGSAAGAGYLAWSAEL